MTERSTLSVAQPAQAQRPRALPPVEQVRLDMAHLWPQPEFKRFLFRILESAAIYTGAYGTDGRHLQFAEGRRSLGFDILRTVEKLDPSAHALIMAEAVKLQENPNARKKYDRLSEIDNGPDGSEPGSAPGDGLVWANYDAERVASGTDA